MNGHTCLFVILTLKYSLRYQSQRLTSLHNRHSYIYRHINKSVLHFQTRTSRTNLLASTGLTLKRHSPPSKLRPYTCDHSSPGVQPRYQRWSDFLHLQQHVTKILKYVKLSREKATSRDDFLGGMEAITACMTQNNLK